MCYSCSELERREQRLAPTPPSKEDDEGLHTETSMLRRRHLWSTIGLCGSSFSMFYLIMNVFPYSGFMALHLLNGPGAPSEEVAVGSENENHLYEGDQTNSHIILYVASNIGPFAGLLASSFRLGRIPTAIAWGRCADVYGRKFALVASIVAMVAGNLLFGLAPTFATAVAIRFCTGLCNGTMVVVRTSISEIARGDPKLEAKGVALMSSMSGYGMLIGPVIGGLLSDPIHQYPNYFRDNNDDDDDDDDDGDDESQLCNTVRLFWKTTLEDYPFLLPNLIGSVVAFLSLVIVVTSVEETLPEDQLRDWRLIPIDIGCWINSKNIFRRWRWKWQCEEQRTPFPNECSPGTPSSSRGPEARTTVKIIDERTPLVVSPINQIAMPQTAFGAAEVGDENTYLNTSHIPTAHRNEETKGVIASFVGSTSNMRYFFYSMWSFAFTSLASLETFPLFAMASTSNGGLGLDETGIGLVQTIGGCIFITGQYTAFSVATSRLGFVKALRISALFRIPLLLMFPLGLYFSPPNDADGDSGIGIGIDIDIGTHFHGNNWYQLGYLGLLTGVISILGSIFMGCATVGVNACIEHPGQRASMNGLQSMVASIGRGLGPIVSGYIVASAMTSGAIPARFGAWVVYGVLMVMETITYLSTRMIPDGSLDDENIIT